MQHPSLARLGASIVSGFAALALSATVAAAQGSTPPKPPASAQEPVKTAAGSVEAAACTVKFAVDSAPISAAPLVINATLSSAIGDSVAASFPSASGITAVSVGPSASAGANALQITLNTTAAKAGEWPVALKGKTGECSGKIKLIPNDK
jgi:hypothetical protein